MHFKLPTQLEGHYCNPLSSLVVVWKKKIFEPNAITIHKLKNSSISQLFLFKKIVHLEPEVQFCIGGNFPDHATASASDRFPQK